MMDDSRVLIASLHHEKLLENMDFIRSHVL